MTTALIIEDEVRNQRMLTQLLETHCTVVKILGYSERIDDALLQINTLRPAVIFLDIQLKDGSGFDILARLTGHIPKIIFTTAYDQYAIKAFKYSAVDYLLKPIIADELKDAVDRCATSNTVTAETINRMLTQLTSPKQEYLPISSQRTIEYLKISKIIRFEAQGAYCKIYMKNSNNHTVSKVLKEFISKLEGQSFYRVHQSHFINLQYIKSYNKSDQIVTMEDGSQVAVSRQNKEGFIEEMRGRSLG